MSREQVNAHPFLAARIELAMLFGLTRPEALLIDLKQADCGHCLMVDIRSQYARSKRRLIMVETGSSAVRSTVSDASSKTWIAGPAVRKATIASACIA
jgi:hypothetical protein